VGFDLTRPLLLGAGLIAIGVVVVTWLRMAPPFSVGRARVALALRVVVVLFLTGALAGLEVQTTPSSQTLMVLADASASTQSARDVETRMVQTILAGRQGSNRAGVLSFGADPQVELNASSNPQFAGFQSVSNPNYTNVAAALQLAASVLPSDARSAARASSRAVLSRRTSSSPRRT